MVSLRHEEESDKTHTLDFSFARDCHRERGDLTRTDELQ